MSQTDQLLAPHEPPRRIVDADRIIKVFVGQLGVDDRMAVLSQVGRLHAARTKWYTERPSTRLQGFRIVGAITDKGYWDSYSNLQRIKHELIRHYLGGWLPKQTLGQYGAKRVLYFDTHAGRGRHTRGQLGSPLVALDTIVKHACFSRLQNSEVRFVFIERDQENLNQLVDEIRKFGTLPPNVHVDPTCGDSFGILDQLLTQIEQKNMRLAPSFVFCDPFGFKVPGSILKRLMKQQRVELFVNIIWRELDMAIKYRYRIDHLRQTRAKVRFLSLEPLLGPLPNLSLDGIHWVIVGGESGPGARPMEKEWVVDLRDQCQKEGVPFFFKQWGGTNKKRTGRLLDGQAWNELPSQPCCP